LAWPRTTNDSQNVICLWKYQQQAIRHLSATNKLQQQDYVNHQQRSIISNKTMSTISNQKHTFSNRTMSNHRQLNTHQQQDTFVVNYQKSSATTMPIIGNQS
jgi:hypothetical protein